MFVRELGNLLINIYGKIWIKSCLCFLKGLYCAGRLMVGRESHYLETRFKSFVRTHIAGSSKGRTLDSLPSNLGSTPSRAPMSFECLLQIINIRALTRICKLNYHFPLEELSLVTSCGVCGLAENAI